MAVKAPTAWLPLLLYTCSLASYWHVTSKLNLCPYRDLLLHILSKNPSYSSSIIFHSPIFRPPTRAIFPKSWRRFRYFRTWRVDNPIESAIWTVLTLGFIDISLYIWRLAFMNSFVNSTGSFMNSFVNSTGSFVNTNFWDVLSVVVLLSFTS